MTDANFPSARARTLDLDRRDAPATREPRAQKAVDRAAGELRRGRPVVTGDGDGRGLVLLGAEHVDARRLAEIGTLSGSGPELAVTARRAAVLGLPAPQSNVVVLSRAGGLDPDLVTRLADPLFDAGDAGSPPDLGLDQRAARRFDAWSAAVSLTKVARLLPAALTGVIRFDGDLENWAKRHDLMFVDAGDVFRQRLDEARTLTEVGAARIPLAAAQDKGVEARVHAFRPADGALEHLAIVIGTPEPGAPALTRVHSECFTGDLLGSLRCDCGDQLKGAIAEIAAAGNGILLYLAQEGRGIGLVNKLRAYELQDRGFDTIDANEQLGFDADERVYLPAAQMLRLLGFGAVRLLTNNPEKVAALERCGIAVAERVPHAFPSNEHNESYLRTKASRAGHLF
ncbi:MAG: GTP cyclohydrolase II [Rhodospirillales bacterium CG15_BIG_FIL_POST_REV_8_21_14_020_66_15]|nr:MAG: GTP cyclohydrolase II [Rhodospirillales bacterium CG15_BIG_FIL_POST_REV_8_21_14_020_66_15]